VLLGDLIARFQDEAEAEQAVLAIGDLAMLAALREHAAATGLGIGASMATAARRYAVEATDGEWITLLGAMGEANDPGSVYLKRALAYVREGAKPDQCGHIRRA
jgi:hypothetical protein